MPPKARATSDGDLVSQLTIARIQDAVVTVPIIGVTPLIPHQWSEKAVKMMREKQFSPEGTTRPKREPKNPVEEAEAHTYWLPDGRPGMPSTAFKAAIVDAARFYDGLTFETLKRIIFVDGVEVEGGNLLVSIDGTQTLREDMPRNSGGTADLRYRYQFSPWRAVLTVRFVPTVVPAQSVYNLVDAAGRGGVGDWRPSAPKSKTGTYGTFRLDDEALA